MRLVAAVLVTLSCVACSALGIDTTDCSGSLERQLADHASCDGAKHVDECKAAGLASVYGVDENCEHPQRAVRGECLARPDDTAGCVATGNILCCPL